MNITSILWIAMLINVSITVAAEKQKERSDKHYSWPSMERMKAYAEIYFEDMQPNAPWLDEFYEKLEELFDAGQLTLAECIRCMYEYRNKCAQAGPDPIYPGLRHDIFVSLTEQRATDYDKHMVEWFVTILREFTISKKPSDPLV